MKAYQFFSANIVVVNDQIADRVRNDTEAAGDPALAGNRNV